MCNNQIKNPSPKEIETNSSPFRGRRGFVLVIDVYYRETDAKTVGILFRDWKDTEATEIIVTYSSGFGEYEPGAFYKRELPCILTLLESIDLSQIEVIIIDGYVYLDNDGKSGLGAYLYKALDEKIPIIGVAKKAFHNNQEIVEKVYRGESENPLYITAIGTDPKQAATHIKEMAGEYRIPTLLKLVDQHTRS